MQTLNSYPEHSWVTYTNKEREHLPLYHLKELKDITNDKAKVSGWVQHKITNFMN